MLRELSGLAVTKFCILVQRASRTSEKMTVDRYLRGPAGRAFQGDDMNAFGKMLKKLIRDEQGGEVLEYALIAGLIVVAAIAVITSVGGKVLARWQSLNSSM
jgi:Flp pilus assembly pilin Flp